MNRTLPLALALLALLATATFAAPPAAPEKFTPPRTDDELIERLRAACRDAYGPRYERTILALLDSLTTQNAPRVRALFTEEDQRGVDHRYFWMRFWRRWGEVDGTAAMTAIATKPDDKWGSDVSEVIIDGWSHRDGASAAAWLRANPKVRHYDGMVRALVFGWARTDADSATTALFELQPNTYEQGKTIPILCNSLNITGGPERVAAWFDRLNDSAKDLAFNHAAWRVRLAPLPVAARWFAAQADQPWRDDKHYYDFIERYVSEDPAAALDWIVSLPPFPGQDAPSNTRAGLKLWAGKDPIAALAWLEGKKNAPWWPRAASGYAQGLTQGDVGAAKKFLDTLDPVLRAQVEKEMKR